MSLPEYGRDVANLNGDDTDPEAWPSALELFERGFRQFAPPAAEVFADPVQGNEFGRARYGFSRGGQYYGRVCVIDDNPATDAPQIVDRGLIAGQMTQLLVRCLDAGFESVNDARTKLAGDPERRREVLRFERNRT